MPGQAKYSQLSLHKMILLPLVGINALVMHTLLMRNQ
jgi:hypothetical protein